MVSGDQPVAGPGAERTALKERSPVVDALAGGMLIALVRKGGIRERRAGFAVRHDRFLLYPTYFHDDVSELAPRFRGVAGAPTPAPPVPGRVRIAYVAEAARIWNVTALAPLQAIADEHALTWPAVEARFHYRGTPGVQVVALRVARLRAAIDLPELRRYGGCVSWVELDEDVDVTGAQPVLTATEFAQRAAALADTLDAVSAPLIAEGSDPIAGGAP
jgi:hypothetical protein